MIVNDKKVTKQIYRFSRCKTLNKKSQKCYSKQQKNTNTQTKLNIILKMSTHKTNQALVVQ